MKMIGPLQYARLCYKCCVYEYTAVSQKQLISWCLQTGWETEAINNYSRMLKWNSSLFSCFCKVVQKYGSNRQHLVRKWKPR